MKYIRLIDGYEIPLVGLGTYKSEGDACVRIVKSAIQNGYRLLDTAAKYGNEQWVGQGILQSDIPRERIKVTSKVWRENMSFNNTVLGLENSLKNLGLNYLDVFLIHWPANAKNYDEWQYTNAEVWRAMEYLQYEGKVRTIGVSNFSIKYLEALFITAKVKPAINQIEFHPGYKQSDLIHFCKQNDIVLEAWSPLARGKVYEIDLLNQLSIKYHKTVAQLCIRWSIQQGVVSIPKSSDIARIKENINVFDFEISEEDMNAINNLPAFGFSGEHPDYWPDRNQNFSD
jgi:diketogulonate reductase-like aldo/keto reductase